MKKINNWRIILKIRIKKTILHKILGEYLSQFIKKFCESYWPHYGPKRSTILFCIDFKRDSNKNLKKLIFRKFF